MDERTRPPEPASCRPQEADAAPPGPAGAHLPALRQGIDYLYCDECGRHVACMPLEGDTWEVQCSRCVGECGLCSCRSAKQCLGKDGAPVDAHLHVARGGRPQQSQSPNQEMGDV